MDVGVRVSKQHLRGTGGGAFLAAMVANGLGGQMVAACGGVERVGSFCWQGVVYLQLPVVT